MGRRGNGGTFGTPRTQHRIARYSGEVGTLVTIKDLGSKHGCVYDERRGNGGAAFERASPLVSFAQQANRPASFS